MAATECRKCGYTWSGLAMAHCSACCKPGQGELSTFSSVDLFDKHRSSAGDRGACRDPSTLRNRAGEPVMFLRNGMWRGPERDEELLAKLRKGYERQDQHELRARRDRSVNREA